MSSPVLAKLLFRDRKISKPSAVIPSEQCDGTKSTSHFLHTSDGELILIFAPFLFRYHHMTVLIYSWYSFSEYSAQARWFIVMNYLVHSVMYTYYALKSIRYSTVNVKISVIILTRSAARRSLCVRL